MAGTYRPGQQYFGRDRDRMPSRRESERSPPRRSSPDYDRHWDRDRRTHDRDHDRDDRYQKPRDRELFPDRAASNQDKPLPGPKDEAVKMDTEKACADTARLIRKISELSMKKIKVSTKLELEENGFKRREQDYEKAAGFKHFPAMAQSFEMHKAHHKKIKEQHSTELAEIDKQYTKAIDNHARLLVEALPIGEIKTRQLVDIAKKEVAREAKPPADERFLKIERQLLAMQEAQNTTATELSKLKRENDQLRAFNSSYEAQAAELATLRTQYEELQLRITAQEAQTQKRTALKLGDRQTDAKVSSLEPQITAITNRLNSHQEDIQSALAEARASLRDEFAILEQRVNEHDNQLSSFDATEYTDGMDKLLVYPTWTEVATQFKQIQSELQLLKDCKANLNGLEQVEERIREQYKQFSDRVISVCETKFKESDARVKTLEGLVSSIEAASTPQAAPPTVTNGSDGLSESRTLASRAQVLEDTIAAQISEIRKELQAHEIMITTLDEQFKNMTTSEMAGIIMEHITRLPAANLSPDIQNLHQRLSTVEDEVKEILRQRDRRAKDLKKFSQVAIEDFRKLASKRSLPKEATSDAPDKRQRTESLSEVGNNNAEH